MKYAKSAQVQQQAMTCRNVIGASTGYRMYGCIYTHFISVILTTIIETRLFVINTFVKMFQDLVTNLDLFVTLKNSGSIKNNDSLYSEIKSKILVELSDEHEKTLKSFCAKFCYNLNRRWQNAHSKESIFKTKNTGWLQENIIWPDFIKRLIDSNAEDPVPSTSTQFVSPTKVSVGVSTEQSPRKPFCELAPKQKKRRAENFHLSSDEIKYAYSEQLKAEGNEEIAEILEHLLMNPQDVKKIRKCISAKESKPAFSPDEALGIFLSLKLTKWQYNTLRKSVIEKDINIFPSYYQVQHAKKECYPPKDTITVTETSAKIKLQALLDITTRRIMMPLVINSDCQELTLISKWGFDGASNQANYKQKIQTDNETTESDLDDSSIFMGSLVPIKLVCGEQVIWQNDSPNSSYWCRPIFFEFGKENKITILREKSAIEEEIANLVETEVGEIKISHSLLMTMIDGKATSILCDSSSQRCDICKATPTEMNNLSLIASKPTDPDLCRYGLSSLHIWIRMMECILHISYRLTIQTWTVKGDTKCIMESRKKNIQDAFKNRMGLLIDIVKQGHGSTNDGNTARRFFANPNMTAEITGVSEDLIRRFAIILEAISSGYHIDVVKFEEYAQATMQLYLDLYSWYYIPSSVHKVLMHGAAIIESFGLIPIGQLSEEAAEARNKDFRRYRQHHSRKCSRKATNEDILNNLLTSSDPLISAKRHKLRRKHKTFSREAQTLLIIDRAETFDDDEQENFAFVNVDTLDSD